MLSVAMMSPIENFAVSDACYYMLSRFPVHPIEVQYLWCGEHPKYTLHWGHAVFWIAVGGWMPTSTRLYFHRNSRVLIKQLGGLNPSYSITGYDIIQATVHRFTVAKWLTQSNALTCNVKGKEFAPNLRRYFWDLFLRSIKSPAPRDLIMVYVALYELTVTCSVSGDNW